MFSTGTGITGEHSSRSSLPAVVAPPLEFEAGFLLFDGRCL